MSAFKSRSFRKPYTRPTDGQWLHDKAPGTRKSLNNDNAVKAPLQPVSVNTKLVVSNLHYEVTPKDLTSIFGQIGTLVREPLIKYDRSGRSLGIAIVSYETPSEATRAKKQFDGMLAKGQQMSIAYDTALPPRRSSSAPSLINRIEKPPLADRLSADDVRGPGPIRNRRGAKPKVEKRPRPAPKKPKTAEELDMELDAFMGEPEPVAPTTSTTAATESAPATQDVEMA